MSQDRSQVDVYDVVARSAASAVIRNYSTSFGWATRLLARSVRSDVTSIYALVRIADEIVDGPFLAADDDAREACLDRLESDVAEAIARGYSSDLVVHAFAGTVRRRGIDAELIAAFFASMRMDVLGRHYSHAALNEYIYGSAEVVGLMCLQVFLADAGRSDYEALAPGARRLGAAFQKINFLRDLAADRDDLGRTYLPGVDVVAMTDLDRDELVLDIRHDLAAARPAMRRLPRNSRRAVKAAFALFAALTDEIARTPSKELAVRRVRVSTPRKVWVLGSDLVQSLVAGGRA